MRYPNREFLLALWVAGSLGLGLAPGGLALAQDADESDFRRLYALDNGDVNGDWGIDLSDPIYLLTFLYSGGPEPVPLALCVGVEQEMLNGDSNGDGTIDVSDGIGLLGWLFSTAPAPVDACSGGPGLGGGGHGSRHERPRIAPVKSRPYGKSYAQWSAEFWRWALSIPAAENPFFTGNCTLPQRGNVWFIAGSFGAVPVCTVPKGKAIFFPLFGTENDFPCPDPNFKPAPGQSLEDFLTEGIQAIVDQVTNVEFFIDGVSAGNMLRQRVTSRLFTFKGDTSLTEGFDPCITGERQPAVSDGYWVMVHPLPPGEHVLLVKVDFAGQHFETENHVTVAGRDDDDDHHHDHDD